MRVHQMSFDEALRTAMMQAMNADERVFAYGQGINDPGGFFGSTVDLRKSSLKLGALTCPFQRSH